jgi:hypothetical protein
MSHTVAVFAVAVLVLSPGAWRHDRDDTRYRTLAANPAFESVGRISGGGKVLGSVVILADRWAVTDAHVVSSRADGETVQMDPKDLAVVVGEDSVGVRSIAIHPRSWPKDVPATEDILARKGIDVALLELQTPVRARPAALVQRPVEPGSQVTFVGFGTAGTARSVVTDPIPAGTKRAGTNVIDQIGGLVGSREIPSFLLVSDFDAPGNPSISRTGDSEPTELEYLPLGGDSGGAAFVRVGEEWQLAGLIATVSVNIPDDPDLGVYGSVVYATAAGAFRDFVRSTLAR